MINIADCGKKGRGVLAGKKFKRGEIIEQAPVIVIPGSELYSIKSTVLNDYYFIWAKDENNLKTGAIALGCGSLYNHSYKPNATFNKKHKDLIIEFKALSDIEEGEEITINYNGDPEDDAPLYFEVVGDSPVL
ncbi:nuclear protein SET [Desulfofarcimen acetoxidans DSM 771]|uniref:Nuclear protein SET n=1 Tax=Desulfofarcimen acetoxidans (strain ATCC 49208 / DSM 771 / KCTC 5769 / VKM B-1644 / 5575) TaxID=485916 RepID=C8W229_DESAS|nr:SET domain-containing protein [Desulfofarcimen acetoxidans]ACV61693.1 nuclear protein SET [Desulfofarcimen acetoxidans DSM 771]